MIVAGIDLAFVRNACGLVIGADGNPWRITHTQQWTPTAGPLRPTETCRAIAQACAARGVELAAADGHYRELLREQLDAVGIPLADSPSEPYAAWEPTQLAFLEDRIQVVRDDDLAAELERVRFTYASGGRTAVHLETSADGAHSDKAAALALCCWLMSESVSTGSMLGGRARRNPYGTHPR